MKATLLSICCLFATFQIASAQELILTMPQKMAFQGDTVSVDVLTLEFDSIVSAQFSMHWDTSVISYNGFNLRDLDLVAVGESDAAAGTLRISWFDIEGEGKTLQDGQVFLSLDFTTVGQIGDVSPVTIDGNPLAIQIFKATDTPLVFDSIELSMEQGSVEIIENKTNTFEILNTEITDVPCANNQTGSIILDVNQENLVYDWSGPNGFTSDMQNIDNLFAGEYSLLITDSAGITLLDTTFTIVQPLSMLEVNNIDVIPSSCDVDSGSAQIDVMGGTPPFDFTLESGMQFNQNNIDELSAGFYPLTITDANGCSIISDFNIGQADTLDFSLGPDITACEGQSVEILAGEFSSYQWSNESDEAFILISEGDNFSVTVTNENGCTASDTINLSFINEVILQSEKEDLLVCPGEPITLNVSGGVNYEWIDPSNELEDAQGSSVIVQPTEDIIYTVISEGECGSGEIDIPVSVHRTTATAGEDICVPVGESAMLQASGGEFYYWSGGEYPLNVYDIPNPTTTPLDSTRYFVMIIDQNACTTFDTVTVFVADDPVSFIPHINMITPNGDGVNDAVDFGDIAKFGTNTFRVFNRWGKIVYEKINYQSDNSRFNGMFNGAQLPAGNYYYVLSFINDQEIRQTLCIVEE